MRTLSTPPFFFRTIQHYPLLTPILFSCPLFVDDLQPVSVTRISFLMMKKNSSSRKKEKSLSLEKERKRKNLSFSPRHGLERRRGPGLLQQEPLRVHRVPPGEDEGSGEEAVAESVNERCGIEMLRSSFLLSSLSLSLVGPLSFSDLAMLVGRKRVRYERDVQQRQSSAEREGHGETCPSFAFVAVSPFAVGRRCRCRRRRSPHLHPPTN